MEIPQGFEVVEDVPDGFEVIETDFAGASIIEPIQTVASGAVRAVAGGLGGTIQALNPFAEEGAGAETVKAMLAGTVQPKTAAGKQGLETLNQLVQRGIDVVNFPMSGIGGLLELVGGQGIEQAVETIKSIQDQGLSETAGSRVFEETGSPLAATVAATAPEAALSALGFKGVKAVPQAAESVITASKPAAEIGRDIFQFQSPAKQRIAKLIEEGSTDVDTAKFMLAKEGDQALIDAPKTKLQEFLKIGGAKVKKDVLAVDAIKQGFDDGVIAVVKGATKTDKAKMDQMVVLMEKGKRNKLFAVRNRPGDIVGDSLMARFRTVRNANRKAGSELEGAANALKGQQVDFKPAIDEFISDLDGMGIKLGDDFQPIFRGSDIEGLAGPESAIKRIVNRLSGGDPPDAFDLHRMKRFIDEQVTFGKTAEGLSGRTELILKNLRRNLDGVLDQNFPVYDKVNTVYSETIGAIDAFQDVAGRKMDLTSSGADKATGTLMRRVMSNAQSRVRLLDAIDEIEGVAKKVGGVFDDDLLTQTLFVDELDSVFGPVARASFQGQIDQAIKQGVRGVTTSEGAVDLAAKAAAGIAEKAQGINEAAAFKAIKKLLRDKR